MRAAAEAPGVQGIGSRSKREAGESRGCRSCRRAHQASGCRLGNCSSPHRLSLLHPHSGSRARSHSEPPAAAPPPPRPQRPAAPMEAARAHQAQVWALAWTLTCWDGGLGGGGTPSRELSPRWVQAEDRGAAGAQLWGLGAGGPGWRRVPSTHVPWTTRRHPAGGSRPRPLSRPIREAIGKITQQFGRSEAAEWLVAR